MDIISKRMPFVNDQVEELLVFGQHCSSCPTFLSLSLVFCGSVLLFLAEAPCCKVLTRNIPGASVVQSRLPYYPDEPEWFRCVSGVLQIYATQPYNGVRAISSGRSCAVRWEVLQMQGCYRVNRILVRMHTNSVDIYYLQYILEVSRSQIFHFQYPW